MTTTRDGNTATLTPPSATTRSLRELRRDTQNTLDVWASQPWLFRQVRKVSIYVTWLLLHTPLTPNAITLMAIAGGMLTGVLFAIGWWITGLAVLALVVVLDFSDGEVSRYRGTQSKEGSYLDKLYIFAVHPSPIAGMTIGVHTLYPTPWVLAAGFVDVISIFLLCTVSEYGRQIAVWKHVGRLLVRLETDPAFLAEQLNKTSSNAGDAEAKRAGFRNSVFGTMLKRALSGWDFPYIFVFMAAAILLQLATGSDEGWFGTTPAKLFLYFYALTYPPIIWAMIVKNVAARAVETDFRIAADQVMRTLRQARRVQNDPQQ